MTRPASAPSDLAPRLAAFLSVDLKAIRFAVPRDLFPAFDERPSAQSGISIIQFVA